ncbi:GCN5 family acetyltransferase [Salinibacterium sp.]|uniref:GCN5 family acetyltransferase n=1 Tax=Salinibacterium sp. TaxID=1915057 RepID=UPI00286AD056|nr:GCN5 family acetyltransferase [Salinibacterium sp.]
MQLTPPDGLGFSFADYSNTLRAYKDAGYAVTSFVEFLKNPQPKHLVLRHDLDNSIEQALRVARLDADAGCSSSIFVRVHARGYNLMSLPSLSAITEMEELGHEIGLHLEGGIGSVLGGDEREWAQRQKNVFEAALGRSFTGFSLHEPARMGGLAFANALLESWSDTVRYHAYEERFTTPTLKYLSDSSGNWREGHFGLWVDKVPQLQVLTHPFWWFDKVPAENY